MYLLPKNMRMNLEGVINRTENNFVPYFTTAFLAENSHKINEQFVSIFFINDDPKNYEDALTSLD